MTQAQQLIKALRKQWMSYADLEALRVSTCPWKRISESGGKYLRPGERIDRKQGKDGLLRLRVVKC